MLTTLGAGDELFHTATGTAYADLQIDGHRETWPIHSKRFRSWLRRRYYRATGEPPSAAELHAALNLLEAQAQFEGPERTVHVRIAEHQGRIYLDLADAAWRAVEIGPEGVAGRGGATGALPPASRPAAAAHAAAGRDARTAHVVAQSAGARRARPGHDVGSWLRCVPAVPIPSW
jgi:hypothetical protein